MATSSIFTEFRITDEDSIARFVQAIEDSKNATAEEVRMSAPVRRLTGDEIKAMFGEHDEDSNG